MKTDRGMIKWQPFDSVISSKTLINNIILEKSKVNKPILSEEEIEDIEEKIIEAYYLQNEVVLQVYKNGFFKEFNGKIKKIDGVRKMVYLNNMMIFFNQIISIH